MAYRSFEQHLDPAVGPKRILALDGGGIRGVLTLGMLAEVEAVLKKRFNDDPAFRLGHYFDLIGGTSTGAIIAAALAIGMTVAEVREQYEKLGNAVFKPSIWRLGLVRQKFDAADVARALKSVFGDRTLAQGDYLTGLMIMSKRLDTGSPWPLSNNPRARYFGVRPNANSPTIPNGEFPLWKVVRASSAAPYFFAPEHIDIARADKARGLGAVKGEFIDGGVSTANNPSLQLLLMATLEGFNFNWKVGPDELLLVSLGTGKADAAQGLSSGLMGVSAAHAMRALTSLMDDCGDMVETVMQWLSVSPTAREIDRETQFAQPTLAGAARLSYLRYNVLLDPKWCDKELGITRSAKELKALEAMDEPDNLAALYELGSLAGQTLVKAGHFGARFDAGVN